MTPSRMLRPVLVSLALAGAGLTNASCGVTEDPNRFQAMAEQVADIPLEGTGPASRAQTASEAGLRPAMPSSGDGSLKVEVMDPHDLWDARDGMRGAFSRAASEAAPRVIEAAAPAVARAVVTQMPIGADAEAPSLRPAVAREANPARTLAAAGARTTIQLGAYSSPAAARSAWVQASKGAARSALAGLSPVYEAVEINGRPLTRLKVAAPAGTAVAICRAAQVNDPWCARRT